MNKSYKTKFLKVAAIVAVLGFGVAQSGVANAASKTITCYKGTA